MASPKDTIPDVYVLWHPDCPVGEVAAKRIHDWLRPGYGLGPSVFYRSVPAPGALPGGLPLPLPGERRSPPMGPGKRNNPQIILPLIDHHMIADAAWRYWLEQLGRERTEGASKCILPVAFDPTAFGIPSPIRELNFIRPSSPRALDEQDDEEREGFLRSLLKQLTEAFCRHLLRGGTAGGDTRATPIDEVGVLKLKVFLSHAKADGSVAARKIRDYIYSQTQLAAFFDENDIPFGSAFAKVLRREAGSTVALIAIRSARYAGRPWCRRELSLFRRPRPVDGSGEEARLWQLSPVIVVDALSPGEPTVNVPEFGNAPIVRWSPEVPSQEEQVVTMLLRDVLLSDLHAAAGQRMLGNLDKDSIVLNWLPDPTTLLHIPVIRGARRPLKVYFPGHLSALELDVLWEMFPHLRLLSFEEGFE